MSSNPKALAASLIEKSDVKAERLISMLRMTLATTLFIGVSFVLRQSESVGLEAREFELHALRLGAMAYFLLGAINFYFAKESRLKPWMSWVFNMGEIVLVSIQLLIDIADPTTPSLLAFASPVLLVVALVICVQALRIQIKLHIYSSIFLIGLCSAILFHDPQVGEPLVMQAERELHLLYTVPPNIMRLIMISIMAVLIGIAIYRSRRLIEAVALETEIAENRRRFLPSQISSNLTDEKLDSLRSGEERDLAVLFADIRSFTSMSEKASPRDTATFLSKYRTLVTNSVESNNGIIDKFIGDGALIVFGLHSDIRQASRDAINAAETIILALETWNESRATQKLNKVEVAIGIHAGPAVIGAIGDDRRLEFTAIGNTVNLAARLEEVAKQRDWTLVISSTTAAIAGTDTTNFTSAGPLKLRGSANPMEVLGRS